MSDNASGPRHWSWRLVLCGLFLAVAFGSAVAQPLGAPPVPNGAPAYGKVIAHRWIPLAGKGAQTKGVPLGGAGGSRVEALSASSEGLVLRTSLPGVGFADTVMADGQQYASVVAPGAGKLEVGKPDVPVFGQWVLIPNGTRVSLQVHPGEARVFEDMDVAPLQPPAEDIRGAGTPLFAKDAAAYSTDADYPGILAEAEDISSVRGQDCTLVWLYPYQYNPVRRTLSVYENLSVELLFEGDTRPVPARLRHPRFEALLRRMAVNAEAVLSAQREAAGLPDMAADGEAFDTDGNGVNGGCEYLVICDAAFQTEADTLAAWKRLSGFSTKVVTTAVTGATTAAIESYIDASQAWSPAPCYVLLIGDADLIPCFYNVQHASDPGRTSGLMQGQVASDRYYADTNADIYADLFVGRLSVESASEAQVAVNRIIGYERTPPDPVTYAAFYTTAGIAAYFQDTNNYDGYADRRFSKTSEDIYQYLTAGAGYSAERIYYTPGGVTPTNWSTSGSYNFENDTPGAALPAYLLKPTFPWDGDTGDITTRFNNGVFLMTHRDHGSRLLRWYPSGSVGYSGGWADPEFRASHVAALTNGALTPIVWSLNCQTGWFDNETDPATLDYLSGGSVIGQLYSDADEECFCEHFILNANGGAVGVIGATRNSYSGINDRLAWGWMDAAWPNFIEYHSGSYGGPDPLHQMGPAFEYGKVYMLSRYGHSSYTDTAIDEFTWFGDPTMEIRTGVPETLAVAHPATIFVGLATDITVTVQKGGIDLPNARVTMSRAAAPDDYWTGLTDASGSVTLSAVTTSQQGDYDLVVTAHNCLPYEGTILSQPADTLSITPTTSFNAAGPEGGPFTPPSQVYTLTNTGASALNWTASKTAAWLDDPSPAGGTINAGGPAVDVQIAINANADALAVGNYSDIVTFTNTTSMVDQTRNVFLEVRPVDAFTWAAVPSPQTVNGPFGVTITAVDAFGATVPGFTGTVDIEGLIDVAPITIGAGAGTWNYPMSTYYEDARTQVIYLAGEIGSPVSFTSLALDVSGLPGQTMNNWTIRIKHTALSAYATAAWEGSGWTVVYQNNESVSSTGWVTFDFSTPFIYNGTDNLMVDFSFNNSSYSSDGQCSYSQPGGNRSIYYRTDSGYGDPLTWSGTSNPSPNATSNVPNIMLAGEGGVLIDPIVSGNFVNGEWNGNITVLEPATAMHLNAEDGSGHAGDSNQFDVDPAVAPAIQNVTSPHADGVFTVSEVIDIDVAFSQNVVVTGTPSLDLNAGCTVDYTGGTGTATLTFTYTVGPGEMSGDLDYTAINALTLNGGAIRDAATNTVDADLQLPVPGAAGSLGANKDIAIDTQAPTVTVTSTESSPTNTSPIPFDIDFDESVSDFVQTDVQVTNGSIAGFSGSGTSYDVSVTPAGDGAVTVTVAAGVAHDAASNPNQGPASHAVTYDGTHPDAAIALDGASPTEADAVSFSVDFTESVAGSFDAADVTVTGSLAGLAGAAVSGIDPDYTVAVTISDSEADGTVGIAVGTAVTDAAGNPFGGGASPLYHIHNWHGFSAQPQGGDRYAGDSHAFNVGVDHGASIPTYHWKWDDGAKAVRDVGGDSDTFTIPTVSTADRGDYWCEVAYDGLTYWSNTATLAVEEHLAIVQQPQGADKQPGESHAFTVATTGGYLPLSYSWKQDGLEVGTNSTYTIDPLYVEHSGTYTVEVADAGTDVRVSDAAILSVNSGAPSAGAAALAALLCALVAGGVAVLRRRQ